MDDRLEALRREVVARSTDPAFPHREWYVTHHLDVVLRIAHELLDLYPEADADEVEALAWLHDIGKTLDPPDTVEGTPREAERLMRAVGFPEDFATRVAQRLRILDRKEALDRAPIEVQIVSSADGCSHLVGPFMAIFWKENPGLPIAELMSQNREKALRGWQKKVVLAPARAAFEARYRMVLEQTGTLPTRFLDGRR